MSNSSATVAAVRKRSPVFPFHGYAGIASMIISQILMFARVDPFYGWFTPIQWTGYVLFLDALLTRLRGTSFLLDRTRELVVMLVASNIYWFMFEGYNLHLRNWTYINLPDSVAVRMIGFIWSFATIFPGILLTNEVLTQLGLFRGAAFNKTRDSGAEEPRSRPAPLVPKWLPRALIGIGFIFCVAPLLVPGEIARYLFAFVWIGFILLLDPINYRWGQPSLLRELESGSVRTLLTLFTSGLICGFLWEFWNYWAETKWVYTVPYFSKPKIFEMPLFGFLGFLPFAVECFVLWHFTRRILPASWTLISKDRTRVQRKG